MANSKINALNIEIERLLTLSPSARFKELEEELKKEFKQDPEYNLMKLAKKEDLEQLRNAFSLRYLQEKFFKAINSIDFNSQDVDIYSLLGTMSQLQLTKEEKKSYIEVLANKGLDLTKPITSQDLTPLTAAAKLGDEELVGAIISQFEKRNPKYKGTPLVDQLDGKGYNALHRAAIEGNAKMVECLLKHKADPTVLAGDKSGPNNKGLNFARLSKQYQTVIKDRKIDISTIEEIAGKILPRGKKKKHPKGADIVSGFRKMVDIYQIQQVNKTITDIEQLLSSSPSDKFISLKDKLKDNVEYQKILELEKAAKTDKAALNQLKDTLCLKYLKNQFLEVIQDKSIPLDKLNKFSVLKLMGNLGLSKDEKEKCIEGLIGKGFNLNTSIEKGFSPLTAAVELGDKELVEIIFKKFKEHNQGYSGPAFVDQLDGNGYNALHRAAMSGNADMVDLLLKNGANPLVTTSILKVGAANAEDHGKNFAQLSKQYQSIMQDPERMVEARTDISPEVYTKPSPKEKLATVFDVVKVERKDGLFSIPMRIFDKAMQLYTGNKEDNEVERVRQEREEDRKDKKESVLAGFNKSKDSYEKQQSAEQEAERKKAEDRKVQELLAAPAGIEQYLQANPNSEISNKLAAALEGPAEELKLQQQKRELEKQQQDLARQIAELNKRESGNKAKLQSAARMVGAVLTRLGATKDGPTTPSTHIPTKEAATRTQKNERQKK